MAHQKAMLTAHQKKGMLKELRMGPLMEPSDLVKLRVAGFEKRLALMRAAHLGQCLAGN